VARGGIGEPDGAIRRNVQIVHEQHFFTGHAVSQHFNITLPRYIQQAANTISDNQVALRVELHDSNVHVALVMPGVIETPLAHAVVDDERFARTVYSDYLRAASFDVEVAADAEAALTILKGRRFDVLVADVLLPGSSGLDLLGAAKQLDPHLEVVMITALDKVDPAVRAMKSGASDYLVKPVTGEALDRALAKLRKITRRESAGPTAAELTRLVESLEKKERTINRFTVKVDATDNGTLASVVVRYSKDGGASWTTADMSHSSPTYSYNVSASSDTELVLFSG